MQITVSSNSRGPSAATERLRCAVVTPVGPGHQLLAQDSAESGAAAFDRWCQDMAYRITHRFAYVHAVKFILEPK